MASSRMRADEKEPTDEDSDDSDGEDATQSPIPHASPALPPGALHPSVGSQGHAQGTCKRCCFFPRGRCTNGYNCKFCHYVHEKRKRTGKKRNAGRKLLAATAENMFRVPVQSLVRSFHPTMPAVQAVSQEGVVMHRTMHAPCGVLHMLQSTQLQSQAHMFAPAPIASSAFQPHQPLLQLQPQLQVQPQLPQSAQPIIMLEPACMSQETPQSGMPTLGYMEVPPPPAHPPNLSRQWGD